METLKHECGVALIRLRKPIAYYKRKYGTEFYGLNKLYLLMEKQHNRGQEGAGLACVSMKSPAGSEYVWRERAMGSGAIQEIFANVRKAIDSETIHSDELDDKLSASLPYAGEVYIGHLRYSTTGRSGLSYVHPFLRRHNWRSRNLLLCGNFNMTNVDDILDDLVGQGQHPRSMGDGFLILEQLGHRLDQENERLFKKLHAEGYRGPQLSRKIEEELKVANIVERPARIWDGGYVICGATGSGDIFALRDPNGIRPAFYYYDDEIVVVASERPVIQTTLNVPIGSVHELPPGTAIAVNRAGEITMADIMGQWSNQRCSFERIYFSRGSDADIYVERKHLGRELTLPILQAVDFDLAHTVLSFIPNTAEVAYIGMMEGLNEYLHEQQVKEIESLNPSEPDYHKQLEQILSQHLRSEKIAIKDIKLRTFIAEGNSRNDLAAHVYDVTYGQVTRGIDNLVVIDDSIVRGTTLRQSIIRILDRLGPKKIVIVSSSPQVRYPDYYGIDMSRMSEFAAFRAAIELLKERGMQSVIDSVYKRCVAEQNLPKEMMHNHVKDIYAPFTDEEISQKIAQMLTPEGTQAEVQLIYQSIEGLHNAIPNHPGDWYFSGNYPTPGGDRLVSRAFINYYEGNVERR